MTQNTRGGTMRQQIFQNMQAKETEELLQIWKKNNRKEWTGEYVPGKEK